MRIPKNLLNEQSSWINVCDLGDDGRVIYWLEIFLIPKTAGVYVIEHVPSGSFYIGSSANVRVRVLNHRSRLTNGIHPNKELQAKINERCHFRFKYFTCETTKDAIVLEEKLIRLNIGNPLNLNLSKKVSDYTHQIGRAVPRDRRDSASRAKSGWRPSTESRLKNRLAHLDRKLSAEHIENIRKASLGRTHSAATKEFLRMNALGNTNVRGRIRPKSENQAISKSLKERKLSQKQKDWLKDHWAARRASNNLPPHKRTVEIRGIAYASIREAGRAFDLSETTVGKRVRSTDPRWSDWSFKTD
jgi:group I intron endonuclease